MRRNVDDREPGGRGAATAMVVRPINLNSFEFVVVSALRAKQLLSGCVPRVDGLHGAATMAQMEVAQGLVARAEDSVVAPPRQCEWQL
jgi:DNA-directed RNA polymerase subunit K/omega